MAVHFEFPPHGIKRWTGKHHETASSSMYVVNIHLSGSQSHALVWPEQKRPGDIHRSNICIFLATVAAEMFPSAGASESASERSSVWWPMVARPCVFVHRVFIQMSFVLMWEVCSMLDMSCERSYGKGSFWILFKPEFLQLVWQFFSFAFLFLSFLTSLSLFLLFLSIFFWVSYIKPVDALQNVLWWSLIQSGEEVDGCVYVCACTCMHIYTVLIHACMHSNAQVHMCANACMRVCTCICVCMHAYAPICVCVCVLCWLCHGTWSSNIFRGRLWFH